MFFPVYVALLKGFVLGRLCGQKMPLLVSYGPPLRRVSTALSIRDLLKTLEDPLRFLRLLPFVFLCAPWRKPLETLKIWQNPSKIL